MIPDKIKIGDEIRIIAPARSIGILSRELRDIATARLKDLGFKVTFGKRVEEKDDFDSSSIKSRVSDLHDAFRDKNVKAIMTVIGGFNSNQLLRDLDYDLIKKNPKILVGYSDITALANAIYKKTGLVTYSGPHYSTFGAKKGLDYTIDYFKKALMSCELITVDASNEWSDDRWYSDQENRNFIKNEGYKIINTGKAQGTIVGANLCTLNLLQGTEFMPSLKNTILFIEDDSMSDPKTFDRDLQSLIHQPGFKGVLGIVIGRFQKKSEMTFSLLKQIIKNKKELNNLPVICDVDFGHTTPTITFPIGGKASIFAKGNKTEIKILKH
jgi:muramoyltetrapeptide carboxypeptidase LdcA involved in peptidoglycan recycling